MGVVPTEYRVHEACIEVATQSTTVYKVGMAYVIVITQARVLCLIYTHDARGRAAPEGECVYISKARVPVL